MNLPGAHSENPHKGVTGLTRILKAFGYSWCGFQSAFRHEAAFRQELVLALVLIPVTLTMSASLIGKALVVLSIFLVLVVELINSAIEAVVDRISLEKHELSKRAKDIGSAAVLLALVNLVFVFGMVVLSS